MAVAAFGWKAGVLYEKDGDESTFCINRHVRRIRAAVAEGAVTGGPAQAVTVGDGFAGLFARHGLDGGFR